MTRGSDLSSLISPPWASTAFQPDHLLAVNNQDGLRCTLVDRTMYLVLNLDIAERLYIFPIYLILNLIIMQYDTRLVKDIPTGMIWSY